MPDRGVEDVLNTVFQVDPHRSQDKLPGGLRMHKDERSDLLLARGRRQWARP